MNPAVDPWTVPSPRPPGKAAGRTFSVRFSFRRSTRRLTLTEAGEAFYEGCAAMVAAARSAHERLADLQDAAVGELRVSAPAGFAAIHLVTALAPFLSAHPPLPCGSS
jgi:DNA-binding transcriptional LysR family regulator